MESSRKSITENGPNIILQYYRHFFLAAMPYKLSRKGGQNNLSFLQDYVLNEFVTYKLFVTIGVWVLIKETFRYTLTLEGILKV